MNITVNIEKEYDIAVIGGGTSGVFAAHAAAKCGAKTLLVEKNGILGGTVVASYVDYPGIFHFWGKQFISGPCFEVIERLAAVGGAKMPANEYAPKRFSSQQVKIDPFLAASEFERLCLEAGVEILMHTMLSFACEDGDGISLALTCKEGLRGVRAKTLIDCTGDANAVSMLGYPVVRSKILQPATYANRAEGYNIEDISEDEVNEVFEMAFERGYLDRRYFSWKTPYAMLRRKRFDIHIPCAGAETSADKTKLELEGHEALVRTLEICRGVRGCEGIKLKVFSFECGVRETCRIVGETEMTKDKMLSGHVYDDAVCYWFYPIDTHRLDGVRVIYPDEGIIPTLPYSAMIPKGSERVLAAGRTVSSDGDTNSAVRVQAPCMAMGTAAGVAAAIAAADGVKMRDADFGKLKVKLKELGAILPEKE